MTELELPLQSPLPTREAALADLRRLIGAIKRIESETRCEPIGGPTTQFSLISKRFKRTRLFFRPKKLWLREAYAFLERLGMQFADLQFREYSLPAMRIAKSVVLLNVDKFNLLTKTSHREVLVDASRQQTDFWNEAASFLIMCNVFTVRDTVDMEQEFEDMSRKWTHSIAADFPRRKIG